MTSIFLAKLLQQFGELVTLIGFSRFKNRQHYCCGFGFSTCCPVDMLFDDRFQLSDFLTFVSNIDHDQTTQLLQNDVKYILIFLGAALRIAGLPWFESRVLWWFFISDRIVRTFLLSHGPPRCC